MGKGRGEREGRARREWGGGGRHGWGEGRENHRIIEERAMMWPLLAPRGCQSKNPWYLAHVSAFTAKKPHLMGINRCVRNMPKEHPARGCWRKGGLIQCQGRGNNCQAVVLYISLITHIRCGFF